MTFDGGASTADVPVGALGAAGADVPLAAPARLKGIAILGSHPATVAMAPFNDPEWYIYSCSPHNVEKRTLPRWDEWFEVHIPVPHQTRGPIYTEALKTFTKTVWMRDREWMHNCPGARLYPEAEMKEEFGPFTFTSSIAYMMAMAIKKCERENIPAMGLFGIMQASPSEYSYQRPGIQNLIWHATKRGIRVKAPDVSKLFEPQPDNW